MTPETIRPLGTKVLAVQYEKPEVTAGGIVVPEQSRRDTTNQWWEVVAVGPRFEEEMGFAVPMGSILKTRWGEGVSLGQDLEGTRRPLFVLDGTRVLNVIPRTWEVEKPRERAVEGEDFVLNPEDKEGNS